MGEKLLNQGLAGYKKKAHEVVAENIEMLIAAVPEDRRATNKFAKYVGVGNGTIDRLRKGDAKARVSTVERIGAKFGLEVWQMLVPGLDLDNRPRVLTPKERTRHDKVQMMIGELQDEDTPLPIANSQDRQPKRVAHKRTKKKEG